MEHVPKVLHIVYNLIRGGTEGQCARAAMELARRGLIQRVALFRREGFFLNSVERCCGPVAEIRIRRMLAWGTLTGIASLARLMRRGNYNVVHAWDADAAVFGAAATRLARRSLITSRRDLGQIYAPWKLRLMAWADRCAGAVIVNADVIRNTLIADGLRAEKITRIPNIVDLPEFMALAGRPFPQPLPVGRLVVMVTRLFPEKDGPLFIRAAARVAPNAADVRFIVAGDGPDRPVMERLAEDLGISDRVTFLGDVPDIPALLARSSVGVLVPKANEGLSNTILEYMAAGLPCVVTDCGGNRELVEHARSGLVVPIGDEHAVAQAIRQLLSDPSGAARMGAEGRRRVEMNHQPAKVAEELLEIYRHVIEHATDGRAFRGRDGSK